MVAKTTVLSLIFCLVLASGVAPAKQLVVCAIINVNSETHKAKIKSYLRQELLKLDDIVIVYDKDIVDNIPDIDMPTHKFRISVLHRQLNSGVHISSTVLLMCFAEQHSVPEIVQFAIEEWGIFSEHFLITGSTLREHCEDIVANFDNSELEALRLAFHK